MSKKFSLLLALVVIATLVLTACQPAATATPTTAPQAPAATDTTAPAAPTATTAPAQPTATTAAAQPTATTAAAQPTATTAAAASGAGKKVCEVTDTGGIDDKSFNATAWKGVENAQKDLGITGKYLESQQQTDYEKNVNAFIDEKCDLIITVGFLLGDATKAAAEKNPNVNFAIVDFSYDPPIKNVLGLTYQTDQAAFLAGYVAAATSKTGKVGTFGGLQIPTVTIFMDGFYYGVQYFNEQNKGSVEVLGWDPKTQKGLFTGNFESTDDGNKMGQTLMDEGADVIMPVAGPVGLGTAEAVKTHGNAWIVGVDTDWTISAPDYKDIVLTSVMKRMDVTVYDESKAVVDGTFKGGSNYVGTLENKGVSLGTISDKANADAVKALDQISSDIVSGKIKIGAK